MSISTCIKLLIKYHIDHPLDVLREAGVVAHLRELLLKDPETSGQVPVMLHGRIPGAPLPYTQHSHHPHTARVQMDLKIQPENADAGRATHLRTDLVVLRKAGALDPVGLCVEANGAGDVTARVSNRDVSAAIEIKSGPVNNLGAQILNDAKKLIAISGTNIERHLIVIDKGHARFGQPIPNRHPFRRVSGEAGVFRMTPGGQHINPSQPFVRVWFVNEEDGQSDANLDYQ